MDIVRLSLLGGLVGLDGTAVGQFMLSRPIVTGALAGWLLGDPGTGLAVGAILELYLLVSFPTGGARFPEGSTATVVAVGASVPVTGPGSLPLAVAVALVWGQIAGLTVSAQRHLNTRLAPEAGERTGARRVALLHTVAIGLDFVRAAALTAAGVVGGRRLLELAVPLWPLSHPSSLGVLLVGGAVSAGILLHDLGGFRRRRVWFVAGLAAGIVGARFL